MLSTQITFLPCFHHHRKREFLLALGLKIAACFVVCMGLNAVSGFMLSQIFMDESSQPNEARQVSMLFHVCSRKCGGNATLMESYMCLNKLKERKALGEKQRAKGTGRNGTKEKCSH